MSNLVNINDFFTINLIDSYEQFTYYVRYFNLVDGITEVALFLHLDVIRSLVVKIHLDDKAHQIYYENLLSMLLFREILMQGQNID